MGVIRGEVRRLVDLSESDRQHWRALGNRSLDANPFFEPDYVEPLARGLGTEAEVLLAVVRDESDWYACMPVHPIDRWHRVPLPAISTWRGHQLYGLLGTPLVASDCSEEMLAHLIDAMRSVRAHPAYLAFDWLAADSLATIRLMTVLDHERSPRRAKPLEFERFERAILRRRSEDTYLEESLSSKHRRELRRQRKKLAEAVGDEPQMVVRPNTDSDIREVIELEGRSTKSVKGTMLADDPGHVDFFLEMCRRFAGRGRLQILALEGGGQTIAIKCNLSTEEAIYGLKIAYAPEWANFSPGIQLEVEMFKYFHYNSEAQFMDSCADANNAMANRLMPDRRTLLSIASPLPGPTGSLARPVLNVARHYRNRRSR